MRVDNLLKVENAEIGFRNFSGRPTEYNAAGNRNFCVFFPVEQARQLEMDGWNIKYTRPSEEFEQKGYLQVKVMMGKYPPEVFLVTRGRPSRIGDETQLDMFDQFQFAAVDLILRPYNWEKGNKSGVSCYLKEGYFVLQESDLAAKYANCCTPEIMAQTERWAAEKGIPMLREDGNLYTPTPNGDLPF